MTKPGNSGRATPARLRAPEQVFFKDPSVDRLLGVVMALATEHFVLRQRVRALESAASPGDRTGPGEAGHLGGDPGGEDGETDADAFARSLLSPLLGLQDSLGAEALALAGPARRRRSRRVA